MQTACCRAPQPPPEGPPSEELRKVQNFLKTLLTFLAAVDIIIRHFEVHGPWGCSSLGRALEWHSRGKGFDPPHLHHKAPIERLVLFSCFLPFFAAQTSPRPRNSGFIFIEKQTGVPPSPAIWQRAAEAPVLLCLGKVQACRVFTGWSRRSWVKPWPRTSLIWVTVMKASGSTEWISSLAA